jgi:hypothetical protein
MRSQNAGGNAMPVPQDAPSPALPLARWVKHWPAHTRGARASSSRGDQAWKLFTGYTAPTERGTRACETTDSVVERTVSVPVRTSREEDLNISDCRNRLAYVEASTSVKGDLRCHHSSHRLRAAALKLQQRQRTDQQVGGADGMSRRGGRYCSGDCLLPLCSVRQLWLTSPCSAGRVVPERSSPGNQRSQGPNCHRQGIAPKCR